MKFWQKESSLSYYKKFKTFSQEQGLKSAIELSFAKLFFPAYKVFLRKSVNTQFKFDEKTYTYAIHPYNVTWVSERAVEVPIILDYIYSALAKNKRILEVGNVMAHYKLDDTEWKIVDKYEKGKNVVNADIVDFVDSTKYDLIFSVSTMEHVGFDEEDIDDTKVAKALNHVQKTLLEKNGLFIFTVPIGYNKSLDQQLFNNSLKNVSKIIYLKRLKKLKWVQTNKSEVKSCVYGSPYAGGNALAVVFVYASSDIK